MRRITTSVNNIAINFDVDLDLVLTFYLAWGIGDTIRIPLDWSSTHTPFSSNDLNAMQDKHLTLSMNIFNQTNLAAKIYALACPSQDRDRLAQIDISEIGPAWFDHAELSFIIPLAGRQGLELPPRGNLANNSISFDERQIMRLFQSDSLCVRWELVLYPTTADALRDTDYVSIDAHLALEGLSSTSGILGGL